MEVHPKGQNFQLAVECQVKQGIGGNRFCIATTVGQRGVGQCAGVDLHDGCGLDVHDRNTELDIGLDVQGKEWRVVGIQTKGGCAFNADFAKVAHVKHDIHCGLYAAAVNQQINRAAQGHRTNLNAGLARQTQHQRLQRDLSRRAICIVESACDRVASTYLLDDAGGVDLQQKAALDAEDSATINDGGRRVIATHFKTAVNAGLVSAGGGVNHQAQGSRHAQGRQDRQIKHSSNAQFKRDLAANLRNDDAEVTLEVECVHQVEMTLACDGGIHAGPTRILAGWVGADGELGKTGQGAECLWHHIGDLAAKGVEAQVQVSGEFRDTQVEIRVHGHAQRHTTAVDDQQAGGIAFEVETVGADFHCDIGKGGKAVFFVQAEIYRAGHGHQAKQINLGLAKQAQELAGVVEHDGLRGVARLDGITMVDNVVAGARVLVGCQRAIFPSALGKVDGGETERRFEAGSVRNGTRCAVFDNLAHIQRDAQTSINFDGKSIGPHGGARYAIQTHGIYRGTASQVDADVNTGSVNHQLFGDDQAKVKVFNDQPDSSVIFGIFFVDAQVAIAVVKIATQFAIHHGGNADEGIGIVDADGQRGDDGFLTIGQRDALRALLGQRHGRRQL